MSDYTRGPWTAHKSKYRDTEFIVQAGHPSYRVLAKFDGDGDGYDLTDVANARIISAAPDMLGVLWEIESYLSELSDVVDGDDGRPEANREMELLGEVRLAIHKAIGSIR